MTIWARCTKSCNRIVVLVVLGGAVAMSGCKSDGSSSTASSSVGSNQAPAISGSPGSSAVAGQKYTFAPVASDADGDALGFSIANRPAWAQFETTTGRLTGTPTESDLGSFANIQISVSDGKATTSLSPFALSVITASGPGGVVVLAWTPPQANVDGSALDNLGGYRIHYGTSADQLTQAITIDDAAATSYQVTGLAPATYFFAVQAFTTDGAESDLSQIASKTVI